MQIQRFNNANSTNFKTQLQSRNKPQNFGTAFIKFEQADLYKLPETVQLKVVKILTDGLDFVNNGGILTSAGNPNKVVTTGLISEKTAMHFTDKNPKKEAQLVRIVKNLFGNENVDAKVIENTPKNKPLIEEAKQEQSSWVMKVEGIWN